MIKINKMQNSKMKCDSCNENVRQYRIKLTSKNSSISTNRQICLCEKCLSELEDEIGGISLLKRKDKIEFKPNFDTEIKIGYGINSENTRDKYCNFTVIKD